MTLVNPTVAATSSTDATGTSVGFPAHVAGDLVIQTYVRTGGGSAALPSSGPAGETIIDISGAVNFSGLASRVWGWVATNNQSAGSVTMPISFTFASVCIVINKDTYGTTVYDSVQSTTGTTTTANVGSWPVSGPGGLAVVVASILDDDITASTPSGWTNEVLENGNNVGASLYTRDTYTSSSETIASTNFGSWGSVASSSIGFVVLPHNIPDVPTTLPLPISILAPTLSSSASPEGAVVSVGIEFLSPQVAGNNTVVTPGVVTLSTEVPFASPVGDAAVAPRVVTLRVEMTRPSEYRLIDGGASRGNGGYEPKATPAERRGQFDLRRRVQDLEP